MKLVIFQRILPPYRKGFFALLAQAVDVILCYSVEKEGASLKSMVNNIPFPHKILSRKYFGAGETYMSQPTLTILLKYKPNYIVSEVALGYVTLWKLIILKYILGFKLIFWSHGINNDEILSPFKGFKGNIRLFLMRRADAHIVYSQGRANILRKYIDAHIPIVSAQNALDMSEHLVHKEKLDLLGKQEIRKQLGWKNDRLHLIYVGRLLKDKRIDMLLEVFHNISLSLPCSLHIIGDGPERYLVEEAAQKSDCVHWYGEQWEKDIIGKLIYASDLFVNPGYVGLSIVDAFAYGCPYIACKTTSEGPFHSPEVEYLSDNINGYIVEYNVKALCEKITYIYSNPNELRKLSHNASLTAVNECSLDNMVNAFKKIISA